MVRLIHASSGSPQALCTISARVLTLKRFLQYIWPGSTAGIFSLPISVCTIHIIYTYARLVIVVLVVVANAYNATYSVFS